MIRISRFPSAIAMAAALSMSTAPAFATELPAPSAGIPSAAGVTPDAAWNSASENARRHRYRSYRRDRGVDAGDVIAGVLVLGTIAAVVSAASRDNVRDRDYRDTRYRTRDTRYRDIRSGDTGGLNRAVDICVQNIERNVRVESVDNVDRNGQGWRVSGSLYNGEGFVCRIGSDGRIEGVDYGTDYRRGSYQGATYRGAAPSANRQYSDETYRQARRDVDVSPAEYYRPADAQTGNQTYFPAPGQTSGQPDYPGGPINGEAEQVDLPQDDDFGG